MFTQSRLALVLAFLPVPAVRFPLLFRVVGGVLPLIGVVCVLRGPAHSARTLPGGGLSFIHLFLLWPQGPARSPPVAATTYLKFSIGDPPL